jgi:hypothetical protein
VPTQSIIDFIIGISAGNWFNVRSSAGVFYDRLHHRTGLHHFFDRLGYNRRTKTSQGTGTATGKGVQ